MAEVEEALSQLKPSPLAEIEVAAEHLETLRAAWEEATREEKSKIIFTLFDALYCNATTKRLVALKPKAAFAPLFREMELSQEKGSKLKYHTSQ